MFTWAMLPSGWSIKPTDHSMHNNIVDAAGNVRGSFFYKAAFYDRSAILYSALTRYHVRQALEDVDRSQETKAQWYDRTGRLTYQVLDRIGGSVLHSVNLVVETENPMTNPDAHRAWWDEHERLSTEAGAACVAWLDENFLGHRDPTAYWP